ncbi:unnamed protein product, partial [Prorocentrum cordatum]
EVAARRAVDPSPDAVAPVAPGIPKVGETLEGRVAYRNRFGTWIDVGLERDGLVGTQATWSLELNQTVSVRVERAEGRRFWVSVPGLPERRRFEDLRVGDRLEGQLARKTPVGVWLDVGVDRQAFVFAAKHVAWKGLEYRRDLVTTVEKIDGDRFWVSVEGLPKCRLSSDLRVGESLDGKVVWKSAEGVRVDVGCELEAKVFAPRQTALDMLEVGQPVRATYENGDSRSIWVSVEGVPKARCLLRDLKVGESLDGTVTVKKQEGVYVDVGCEKEARVLAPRRRALGNLEIGEAVKATVQRTSSSGTWVSLSNLPVVRMIDDLKEGEVIEAKVSHVTKDGAYVDVGTTAMARVLAPRDASLDSRSCSRSSGRARRSMARWP